MNKAPAYGTPERAEWDKRVTASYKVQEWAKQQLVEMIGLDDKQDRLKHFHDVHNFFLNLRNTIIEVHEGCHVHFCTECGKPEKACYIEPTGTKLKKEWVVLSLQLLGGASGNLQCSAPQRRNASSKR